MTTNKLYVYMSMLLMITSLMMLIFSIYMIIYSMVIMMEWAVLSINSCYVYMTLIFDYMSMMFASTVTFISSTVIFYSGMYMENDKFKNRFVYIVIMFVLSMMLMIISPNMISIILGWDGLGLVSYCLVIYYQNLFSSNAGMLTALMNRVGDVLILMTIAWMLNFGSWNFFSYFDKMSMNFVSVMIIIASFTKSAQIPFSSWLPAAMAAPTPVSALVHSSTLVTAGVYLMIRFNKIIYKIDNLNLFMLLSIFTMLMSGLGANFEFDLKKIIALSTLSQLGIMMTIIMFGYPMLSFFHLIVHALFKASLFLCAGVIIHCLNNNQDIRLMGCLSYQMPMTMSMMNIANLSLCGIPFMSGFYSKDLIMESMCSNNINMLIMLFMYLGIGLTSFYSIRMTFYGMMMNFSSYKMGSLSENINNMTKSILILTFYSILSGSMFSWLLFDQMNLIILSIEAKMMAFIFSVMGIWLGYEISLFSTNNHMLLKEFLGSMWFMKQIFSFHNQFMLLGNSKIFQKIIDSGWGEKLSSLGLINLLKNIITINLDFIENNFKIQLMSFIIWMILILMMFL